MARHSASAGDDFIKSERLSLSLSNAQCTFIYTCFYFYLASRSGEDFSSFVLGSKTLAGWLPGMLRAFMEWESGAPSVPRAARERNLGKRKREKEQIIFIRGFYFVCVGAENESCHTDIAVEMNFGKRGTLSLKRNAYDRVGPFATHKNQSLLPKTDLEHYFATDSCTLGLLWDFIDWSNYRCLTIKQILEQTL